MGRGSWARGIVAAVLSVLLGVGLVVLPSAPSAAVSAASTTSLKAQAIYFLRTGDDARRALVLDALASRSAWDSQLWADFLTSWDTINQGMKMNSTVPKGLPSKGHVFIVLGSALSKSGKMTTKLERRMKLALAAIKKYPRSQVLVSGGAPRRGHTEAEVMASWLRARKVPASRILVEKKSPSTVGNATYSMAMLAKLPKITSYSLISDSSHLRRASILFRAATVRVQEQSGKAWPIKQLANVAYRDMTSAGRSALSSSSIGYTASNVASVLKVLPTYKDVLDDPPSTPVLTSLAVTAPAKVTYAVGEKLDPRGLAVKAVYNKGVYTRLVTNRVALTGFDTTAVGDRTAVATFADGAVTKTAGFGYRVVKASSALSWKLSTKAIRRSKTRVKVQVAVTAPNQLVVSGKVRYYLDGKRLKTVVLGAGAAPVSFTYPKISTAGKHRFTVSYSGNAQLAGSRRSIAVTVTR